MTHGNDLGSAAKEHVKEIQDQAKDAAAKTATAHANQARDAAAARVDEAARAADAAASEMAPNSPQAQAVQQVADHIEGFATQLRTADVQKLAQQATTFARQNPLVAIGGAALVGFAAARFLKARSTQPMTAAPTGSDPWANPYVNTREPEEQADPRVSIDGTRGANSYG
ncbi:hypothetical protein [Yoonia litorea]|uniref:Membrane-anchored ribosome-binding protein, inhibits growth in stationary phase, ElaB/YqjD/DUF883 family n=1 Tax=Yoonia litorea TaxID=1123755 RepID=A0A1I6N029_9RHOB|nr:hypothetical protein [Yoonia litorea]SFS21247.1 hypothetical protein SAMN05444714_2778 [Yoonia litorea]